MRLLRRGRASGPGADPLGVGALLAGHPLRLREDVDGGDALRARIEGAYDPVRALLAQVTYLPGAEGLCLPRWLSPAAHLQGGPGAPGAGRGWLELPGDDPGSTVLDLPLWALGWTGEPLPAAGGSARLRGAVDLGAALARAPGAVRDLVAASVRDLRRGPAVLAAEAEVGAAGLRVLEVVLPPSPRDRRGGAPDVVRRLRVLPAGSTRVPDGAPAHVRSALEDLAAAWRHEGGLAVP